MRDDFLVDLWFPRLCLGVFLCSVLCGVGPVPGHRQVHRARRAHMGTWAGRTRQGNQTKILFIFNKKNGKERKMGGQSVLCTMYSACTLNMQLLEMAQDVRIKSS